MPEVKILSAKLIKGGDKLEIKFNQSHPVAGSDGFIGENRPHQDLINKFQALRVHMAILSDYIKPKDTKKADLEKFVVTSYHYVGKEDAPAIKIIGYKLTSYGTSGINPNKVLLSSGDNEYPLLEDLLEKLADVDAEVSEYLDGKKAPDPQQSLEFPDDEEDSRVTNIQIDEPEEEEEEEVNSEPLNVSRSRIQRADPEAMERVKEWTPGEYLDEVNASQASTEKPAEGKGKRGRKTKNK